MVQNTLFLNLQTFVLQWESGIHQELLTHWTNGLLENQNKNLGTHLRLFLHNTPENWSTQVHMYAYAHNSQPHSELNLSPYEIVFHTIPRIPINFELNLLRDT